MRSTYTVRFFCLDQILGIGVRLVCLFLNIRYSFSIIRKLISNIKISFSDIKNIFQYLKLVLNISNSFSNIKNKIFDITKLINPSFNALATFRPRPSSGERNKSLNYMITLSVKQNGINFPHTVYNVNSLQKNLTWKLHKINVD